MQNTSQVTNTVFLIKPSRFDFNADTAASNSFQHKVTLPSESINMQAKLEFEAFAEKLKSKGVTVLIFEDTLMPHKPDSIFPNNWITCHQDGTIILYPMCAPNRRLERRNDIVDALKKNFSVTRVIDFSGYEKQNRFLEGTGSIIFDHLHKIAYACLSPRTDRKLFIELCQTLNYKPICFYAHNRAGQEIYHTNVMMCVAEKFAVICLESIAVGAERNMVVESLEISGHEIIDISFDQMNHFAGNMLGLKSKEGRNLLALSQSAYDSLTYDQKAVIEKCSEFVPLPINIIETIGGGSARCMIAEIFLPTKSVGVTAN